MLVFVRLSFVNFSSSCSSFLFYYLYIDFDQFLLLFAVCGYCSFHSKCSRTLMIFVFTIWAFVVAWLSICLTLSLSLSSFSFFILSQWHYFLDLMVCCLSDIIYCVYMCVHSQMCLVNFVGIFPSIFSIFDVCSHNIYKLKCIHIRAKNPV